MGLMGTSIAASLLIAGHRVTAVEPDSRRRIASRRKLSPLLEQARRERLLNRSPGGILARFAISGDYTALEGAQIVIESTVEDAAVKKRVIALVERVVGPRAIIATNTSAIPITDLQAGAQRPERIIGIHWGEPAHITRFMEIICGRQTSRRTAERAMALARSCGKEPSLVRKDVRGFITNRVMYAMFREAFHLVESGVATIADVDRSLRNDLGYWLTFAGPFRFMDLTGIPAYDAVMRDLLPDLSCATKVPPFVRKVVSSGAKGIGNAKGFYSYTPAQARRWEQLYLKFSYDIRRLAQQYPEDAGDRPRPRKRRGARQ